MLCRFGTEVVRVLLAICLAFSALHAYPPALLKIIHVPGSEFFPAELSLAFRARVQLCVSDGAALHFTLLTQQLLHTRLFVISNDICRAKGLGRFCIFAADAIIELHGSVCAVSTLEVLNFF